LLRDEAWRCAFGLIPICRLNMGEMGPTRLKRSSPILPALATKAGSK
jgi:hypothetical protein